MKNLAYILINYYIANIADMALFYILLRPICFSKQSRKNGIVTVLFLSQFVILVDYFCVPSSIMLMITVNIAWFFLGSIIEKHVSKEKIIFQLILASVILVMSNIIFTCIPLMVFKLDVLDLFSKGHIRWILIIFSKVLEIILAFYSLYLIRYYKILQHTYFFRPICCLFSLFILNSLVLLKGMLKLQKLNKAMQTNTTMVLLITELTILAVIVFVIQVYKKLQYMNKTEVENHTQKLVLDRQKDAIKMIRTKQHEYKNHIESINALLLEHDINRAEYYILKLLEQSIDTDQTIKKNASFMEILIDYKLKEARTNEIQIIQKLTVCHDIPIEDYDLAIVINNAMNNAIEACIKLPANKRYIKCIITIKLSYLNFYFENSCREDIECVNDELLTTKDDKAVHGFGLQNIKQVVNKYNGIFMIGANKGIFTLKCSLLIPEDSMKQSYNTIQER
ncbi:sensor histidine kinase [Anaerosporobacter sp.]